MPYFAYFLGGGCHNFLVTKNKFLHLGGVLKRYRLTACGWFRRAFQRYDPVIVQTIDIIRVKYMADFLASAENIKLIPEHAASKSLDLFYVLPLEIRFFTNLN